MKWLLHNLWIKLLAVIMAFLLWLHVATEKAYEIELTYHLDVTGLASDLLLASPQPRDLTVRCRGTGKRLLLLLFRERVWPVNLSAYTRGTADIQLSVQEAPTVDAEEVQFLSITRNKQIRLEIDRRKQKTVPIVPGCQYEMRRGFVRIGSEVLDPDSVVLSGPAGALKSVTTVKTRPRTFTNLAERVDTRVELEPVTAFNVTSSVTEIRLVADVQPYAEKTFDGVPVVTPRTEDGGRASAEPGVVSVTVGGGRQALDTLTAPHIHVELAPTTVGSAPVRAGLSVQIPSGFQVVGIRPDSVLVHLP